MLALGLVPASAGAATGPTYDYIRSVAGSVAAARYTPVIERSAARWHLDPVLVARVIRLESSFKPREVSRVGAIGLMQVMPCHFAHRGIPRARRFDPATNIDLGCHLLAWYLRRMTLTYRGLDANALTHRALVAYNMGPQAVSRGIYRSRYSRIILASYRPPAEGSVQVEAPPVVESLDRSDRLDMPLQLGPGGWPEVRSESLSDLASGSDELPDLAATPSVPDR
jgi:soluble lytic murein transglycosylase-like protein